MFCGVDYNPEILSGREKQKEKKSSLQELLDKMPKFESDSKNQVSFKEKKDEGKSPARDISSSSQSYESSSEEEDKKRILNKQKPIFPLEIEGKI
jgi:hypothetical protein